MSESVKFVDQRVPVYWGDFSQGNASLLLLKNALYEKTGFEFFVFLSGRDLPIRPIQYIHSYIHNHADYVFMDSDSIPSVKYGKGLGLLEKDIDPPCQGMAKTWIRGLLKRVRVLPRKRDFAKYFPLLRPYGGSSECGSPPSFAGEAIKV